MSLRAILTRLLTVRESHDDPAAPLDRLGNQKVRCEQCGKFVGGLRQHRKDAHGSPNRCRSRAPERDNDGDNAWFHDPDMGSR